MNISCWITKVINPGWTLLKKLSKHTLRLSSVWESNLSNSNPHIGGKPTMCWLFDFIHLRQDYKFRYKRWEIREGYFLEHHTLKAILYYIFGFILFISSISFQTQHILYHKKNYKKSTYSYETLKRVKRIFRLKIEFVNKISISHTIPTRTSLAWLTQLSWNEKGKTVMYFEKLQKKECHQFSSRLFHLWYISA